MEHPVGGARKLDVRVAPGGGGHRNPVHKPMSAFQIPLPARVNYANNRLFGLLVQLWIVGPGAARLERSMPEKKAGKFFLQISVQRIPIQNFFKIARPHRRMLFYDKNAANRIRNEFKKIVRLQNPLAQPIGCLAVRVNHEIEPRQRRTHLSVNLLRFVLGVQNPSLQNFIAHPFGRPRHLLGPVPKIVVAVGLKKLVFQRRGNNRLSHLSLPAGPAAQLLVHPTREIVLKSQDAKPVLVAKRLVNHDVGAPPRHVCRHGNHTGPAGGLNYRRLLFADFSVKQLVRNALALQQIACLFGCCDGSPDDKERRALGFGAK